MGKTKYIDAERFVEYFGDWYTEEGTEIGFVGPIKDLVFRMPAVDVVEASMVRQVLLAEFGEEETEAVDALMEKMK